MIYKGDYMTKDIKKFEEVLTSYVYLKECAAIAQEREETGYDIEVYDLEDYLDDLKNIASKHQIPYFKIDSNYNVRELTEYVNYLENKFIQELKCKLRFMYQYDK